MKKTICLAVALLAIAGCIQEQGYYERLADAVNRSVDSQQESTHEIVAAIKDSQIVPVAKLAKIEDKIAKADELIDIAQIAAAEAAKVYEEKRSEDPTLAVLEAARVANRASAIVNPYATLIETGLAIAIAVAGGYGILKRRELTKVSDKYKAHKQGVEYVMRNTEPDDAQKLYDAIGDARNKLKI